MTPDSLKKKNVDKDADRHYGESLDYFRESEKEGEANCPECAKAQKHVRMVRTEGEEIECPECHYLLRRARRI